MTKEIFVDRSGNRIDKNELENYDMIGFRYNDKEDTIIWEYTRRNPAPVLGVAIIGCLVVLLLFIVVMVVIYLL